MSVKLVIPQEPVITEREAIVGNYKEIKQDRQEINLYGCVPLNFGISLFISLFAGISAHSSEQAPLLVSILIFMMVAVTFLVFTAMFGGAFLDNKIRKTRARFNPESKTRMYAGMRGLFPFSFLLKEKVDHFGYDVLDNGNVVGNEVHYTHKGIFIVVTHYQPVNEETEVADDAAVPAVDRLNWLGGDK